MHLDTHAQTVDGWKLGKKAIFRGSSRRCDGDDNGTRVYKVNPVDSVDDHFTFSLARFCLVTN